MSILMEFMQAGVDAWKQEMRAHPPREGSAPAAEVGTAAGPGARRTVRIGRISVAVDVAFVMVIGYQAEATDL